MHCHAERLSDITTLWDVLRQAHEAAGEPVKEAQQSMIERYGTAIRRYLVGALRDAHAADDVFQEFGLGLIRGAYRNVEPERGRFRDYIKTVLWNLVRKHHRARRRPAAAPAMEADVAMTPAEDKIFNQSWRTELLDRSWRALDKEHTVFAAVLRFRVAHPRMPSAQLAQQLRGALGRPFTAAGVRQTLRRARTLFARLLLDEVVRSLRSPTANDVEQELRELDLLVYCQPALHERFGTAPTE